MDDMEPIIQKEAYRQFEQDVAQQEAPALKGKVYTEVIRLRDLEREAVIQCFWENLTLEEISKKMRLSKRSVQKLLELALSNIRARLTQDQIIKEWAQE